MKKFLILLSALLLSVQAQAALVGVTGGGEIISAVSVKEDGVENDHQQGFNEKQGVLLSSAVAVDGGTIAAGTRVDSHLIFLNSKGNTLVRTSSVWEFSGNIIGIMTDSGGTQMAGTDSLFAAFSDYFSDVAGYIDVSGYTGIGFNAQGLEGFGDSFATSGNNFLKLSMNVTEPGDWIRVLTVSAVPVPAALFMFAPALLGFLGLRRKSKAV